MQLQQSPSHVPAPVPIVGVVIVNYNGWREVIENLSALLCSDVPVAQVVIVDNESQDGSLEHIASWLESPVLPRDWKALPGVQHYFDLHGREPIAFRRADARTDPLPLGAAGPRVILLRSGRNGGFAAGCNLGARALGPACDFTWYLNPDTVVTTDTLARLLERALAADRPGMVGATLRYYDQPDLVQVLAGGAIDARSGEARHIGQHCPIAKVPVEAHVIEAELAYIMGACMLVSRSFLEQVGPMREDYFLYYEDADWGVRGAAHFKLGYAPASHVFHKSGTSTSRALPAFSARFYYRNGIRFLSRHFPQHLGRARTLLLCETLRLARRRRWQECVIAASTWWNARRLAAEARR